MKELVVYCFKYLWSIRTTAFGYLQVILGVLAVSGDLFGTFALKCFILANAMLLAILGHYNNRKKKQADAADPQP